MAQAALRRAENVAGDLFVDATCIDCDTCRWMAPRTFARVGRKSAVARQPETAGERRAALHALLSCPTASIGTVAKAPDLAQAQQDFPLPVAEGVLHCGYHSEEEGGQGVAAAALTHRGGQAWQALLGCLPTTTEPRIARNSLLQSQVNRTTDVASPSNIVPCNPWNPWFSQEVRRGWGG